MSSTCAQTSARSRASVAEPEPKIPERASATGDQPAGHSLRSSAIRLACHSSSVVTMPAIMARIRSASPRWLPSKRAGRWSLRIATAASTPASTRTAKTSTSSANQPWWPSHGSVAWRSTAPIIAITIVGQEDEEPPEDRGVHQARDRAAGTACAGRARSRPRCGRAAAGRRSAPTACPSARGPRSASPAREQSGGDGEHRRERKPSGQDVYGERAFRSSAVIAGTISVRSPITA